jgi:hypothetical protein
MKDKEILESICSEKVIRFFLEDKFLILNNAYKLLSLLKREHLIEEAIKKVYSECL